MIVIRITAHSVEAEDALRELVAAKPAGTGVGRAQALFVKESRSIVSESPLVVDYVIDRKGLLGKKRYEKEKERIRENMVLVVEELMRSKGVPVNGYSLEMQ